ncbi:MAG: hypothetical protein EA400_05630 [Chromatiaceae bacterium]|nr:MAG: hypothetical protein EA400_05630 [Chromatiaceae bacterium]
MLLQLLAIDSQFGAAGSADERSSQREPFTNEADAGAGAQHLRQVRLTADWHGRFDPTAWAALHPLNRVVVRKPSVQRAWAGP